jgi:thiamine-monophosphate kinase
MTRRRDRSLAAVGEHGWLASLLPTLPRAGKHVVVGPGDDGAVLRPGKGALVVSTDALVEGVHFERGWIGARALGVRAYRVAASDIGAMGARPIGVVLSVGAPSTFPARDLTAITRGLAAEGARHGAPLVGGNLTRASALSLTVTVFGEAPGRVVCRDGARPGDVVVVSGSLGGMTASVAACRRARGRRLASVPDRVALGVALASLVSGLIDVSDGLQQDLGHLCDASGVGAVLSLGDVPLAPACRRAFGDEAATAALTGGEDYELLATVRPGSLAAARRAAKRQGTSLAVVGAIVAAPRRVRVIAPDGSSWDPRRAGFDHFR